MARIAVLGVGDGGRGGETVPDPILELASTGIEPVLRPLRDSAFPGTPGGRAIAARAYLAAGIEAEEEGFDAVLVNTVGDYGLPELRARLRIPVVGCGEAAIRLASLRGAGFSIVTLWPPQMGFIYRLVLAQAGAEAGFRGIRHLSQDADLENLHGEGDPIAAFMACGFAPMQEVKAAIGAELGGGAASVILGCTCMAGMLPILREAGLPVIEPMRAGWLAAEALLRAGA